MFGFPFWAMLVEVDYPVKGKKNILLCKRETKRFITNGANESAGLHVITKFISLRD